MGLFDYLFLLLALVQWVNCQTSDAPDVDTTSTEEKSNWFVFALLGSAWGLVFLLFLIIVAIRMVFTPRTISTYNLSSSPTSFYMLKVKTGSLPAGFVSGKYEISLDLINKRYQTLGRVKLPIDNSGKAGNPQTVYVKLGTREPFDVGAIRAEHTGYRENVSLENIELRELDGSGKVFRADINTKIGFNAGNPRRQIFKVFLDDASIGTAELFEPGEDNLSLLDWVFFLFFAINVIMLISLFVHQHVWYHQNYADSAISGCTTAVIALALTIGLVLVYRFLIKKNMPKYSGLFYVPQVIFFSVCFLFAAAFGITAAVLGAIGTPRHVSNQSLTYWGVACAISLVVFLILFIPIVVLIEYCIRRVRPNNLEQKSSPMKEPNKQDSHGNEYFMAITKKQGGSPIHSISQYRKKGPNPATVKPPTPPAPAPIKKHDSTGSEYFNQINRAGVRSISQYAALKKK